MGTHIDEVVVGGLGEAAYLADERLGPVLDVALSGVGLRYPHPATTDDVGDDVQALHLVSLAGVVGHDGKVTPLEVLNQADACGLVLDQHEVNPLLVPALTVDHLELLHDLGAQVGVLEPVLPAVDEHDRHRAIQRLEHAPRPGSGGVVLGLLAGGAVVGLDDVLELGELPPGRPELEHVPLDDATLLGVDDFGVNLLPPQLGALELENLLLEVLGQVGEVGVGRGGGHHHVVAVPPHQFDDEVFRFGCRGADESRPLA